MIVTLQDIIDSGDFSGFTREKFYPNSEEEFGNILPDSDDFWDHWERFSKCERLEMVVLREWLCVDTHVGLYLIILNDIPIAARWQPYRKVAPAWSFISGEDYDNLFSSWMRYSQTLKPEINFFDDSDRNIIVERDKQYTWKDGPYYEIKGGSVEKDS